MLASWAALALASASTAQHTTWFEGPTDDQLTVRTADLRLGGPGVTLPGPRKIRPVTMVATTANQARELDRVRQLVIGGWPGLETPRATRLFVYERLDQTGHGILLVARDGTARDVYEGLDQLDAPLAVAPTDQHLAFASDTELVVVRLDGNDYPSTGRPWRTITVPTQILPESVTVGASHAFFVSDDDRLWRCGLADGSVPTDVTPLPVGPELSPELAISGDGGTLAFLRDAGNGTWTVHVVGANGPARQLALAPRPYRHQNHLPNGSGQPGLLLDHTGSRLMAIEAGFEDEVHVVDTAPAATPSQVTRDEVFATYIGVHILPKFRGRDLLLAAGHAGWADWYVARADGSVANVTQTGSPEPPFFVGSLDVAGRFPLGDGSELSLERLGAAWQLRRMDTVQQTTQLLATANAPPTIGSSLLGAPDLLAETGTGQLWLDGRNGALRAFVPAGLATTPPLRAQAGWAATLLQLSGSAASLPVLLLDDQTVLTGTLAFDTRQIALTQHGDLVVLRHDRIDVVGVAGAASFAVAPANVRSLVSGAVH
jgi:hypothetical protein